MRGPKELAAHYEVLRQLCMDYCLEMHSKYENTIMYYMGNPVRVMSISLDDEFDIMATIRYLDLHKSHSSSVYFGFLREKIDDE